MPNTVEQAPTPKGQRFVEFDEFIDYQLNRTSQTIQSTDIMHGVVGAVLGVVAYVLLFTLADHWLFAGGVGPVARVIFSVVGLAALGVWVVVKVIGPWRKRVNVLYAARQIEKNHPDLKSSLLSLIDLKQSGRTPSEQITGSLEKRAALALSKTVADETIDRRPLLLSAYALLFLIVLICVYAFLSPKSLTQSIWRALMPFSGVSVSTRTRIDRVSPGSVTVPALSHVTIEVEVSGEAPAEATALYTTADGAFVNEPVVLRETGEGLRRYRGVLMGPDGRGLRQNLTYCVEAGDARTQDFTITVVQAPSAVVKEVSYQYPKYTALPDRVDQGGSIDAWEGTRVEVTATANQNVASAQILFSDTEDTSLKAEELTMIVREGRQLSAVWPLAFRSDKSSPGFYRIQVKTLDGHTDPQPTLYPIRVRADLPPIVEILHPASDVKVPVNGAVSLAWRAADPDFLLRSVVLYLEQDGKITSTELFMGPPDVANKEGRLLIKMSDLKVPVGGRITCWLEARDNFEPFGERGLNKTLTRRLNIDVVEAVSPEEAPKQEQAAEKQAEEALKRVDSKEGDGEGKPQPDENGKGQEQTRPDGSAAQGDQATSEGKPNGDPTGDQNTGDPGMNGDSAPKPMGEQAPSPGDNQEPQPGDQQSRQQDGQKGASSGDKGGQTGTTGQNGEGGESQSDPNPSRQPQQSRSGQTGNRSDQQDGSKNGQSGAGDNGAPRDKAPEDTALQRLLKWDRERREKEGQQAQDPSQKQEPGSEAKPSEKAGENGQAQDPSQTPMNEPKTGQKPGDMPGSEGPEAGKESGDSKTGDPQNSGKEGTGKETGNEGQSREKEQLEQKGMSARQQTGPSDTPPPDGTPTPRSGQNSDMNPGQKDAQKGSEKGDKSTGPGEKGPSASDPSSKPNPSDMNSNDPSSPGEAGDANSPGKDGQQGQDPMSSPGTGKTRDGDPNNSNATPKGLDDPNDPGSKEAMRKGTAEDKDTPREQGMTGDNGTSSPGQEGTGQQGKPGDNQQGDGKNGRPSDSQNGAQQGTGQKPEGEGVSSPSGKQSQGGDSSQNGSSGKQNGGDQKSGSAKENGSGQPSGSGDMNQKTGDMGAGNKPDGQSTNGEQGDKGSDDSGSGKDMADSGKSGQNKSGQGESGQGDKGQGQSGKPGQNQQGSGESGQQGESGKGESGQGSGQSGAQSGAQGENSTQGESGTPGGREGSRGGTGRGSSAMKGDGTNAGEGGSDGGPTADAADLENRKKAANLALKRLQDTLERGQIDQELQKELGYSDEELRDFMHRLQERLADSGEDLTPEAQTRRRQFESLLKGINLQTETQQRSSGEPTGPAGAGFSRTRRQAPLEYRAAEKKYRESLSGQRGASPSGTNRPTP